MPAAPMTESVSRAALACTKAISLSVVGPCLRIISCSGSSVLSMPSTLDSPKYRLGRGRGRGRGRERVGRERGGCGWVESLHGLTAHETLLHAGTAACKSRARRHHIPARVQPNPPTPRFKSSPAGLLQRLVPHLVPQDGHADELLGDQLRLLHQRGAVLAHRVDHRHGGGAA